MKAGLERDKAALLVVLGAMRDGTKEVLALRSGYRESVKSWSEVLRDLKARGIEAPRLLMADGNAAIWGVLHSSATLGALTGLPACCLHSHYGVRSHIWPRRRTFASIVSTTVTALCATPRSIISLFTGTA